MSAQLESTYNQSPERTAHRLRQPKLEISSVANSSSPNQQATDRLCVNRSNVTKNLQNIYLKETERYIIKSYYNSPVVLTQHEEQSESQNSSWKFFQNAESKKVEEEVNKFQILLTKFGLFEVFRTFQLCREKLIEILSSEEKTECNKNKIQILEAIANLKMQLSKTHDFSLQKSSYEEQVKELLMDLSKMRKQNDFLKDKNAELYQRLQKYQNSESFLQNSLFCNSIEINNSTSFASQSLKQLSFDLQLESLKIKELQTVSNSFLEESQKSISSVSQLVSKNQSKRNENEGLIQEKKEKYRCFHHQSWKMLVMNCIKLAKTIFKNQFQATNLALIDKDCQSELKAILESYKDYKKAVREQNEQSYLSQCSNFFSFIESHSSQLSSLVDSNLKEYKTKKKLGQERTK